MQCLGSLELGLALLLTLNQQSHLARLLEPLLSDLTPLGQGSLLSSLLVLEGEAEPLILGLESRHELCFLCF